MQLRLRNVYNHNEEHCFGIYKDGQIIQVVLELVEQVYSQEGINYWAETIKVVPIVN